MKELYEKYKGRHAHLGSANGKVAGYSQNYLIMITEDYRGWLYLNASEPIIYLDQHPCNSKFLFINEEHISSFKFGR